jgi:hypothetical protein
MTKSYRRLFYLACIVALVAIGFIFYYYLNSKSIQSELQLQQALSQQLELQNEFYTSLFEADSKIVFEENYEDAIKAYQYLLIEHTDNYVQLLNARINSASEILNRPVSDNGAARYQAIIRRNNKTIDSLTNEIARLKITKGYADSLKFRIASLSDQLIAKNNELSRKQSIQVITFKNENGRLIHYLGEVSNEKANGGGVGIWNTGSIYRGEWKDNKRHGKGTFEWADGEKYVGEYNNDKREGEGTYYWPSGERYEGEWNNDKREGYGVLFDQDGNIRFEGPWKEDKPNR